MAPAGRRSIAAHLSDAIEELVNQGIMAFASVASASALLSGAMNEAALCIADSECPSEALEDVTLDLFRMMDGMRSR